jgi:hypothetical protein
MLDLSFLKIGFKSLTNNFKFKGILVKNELKLLINKNIYIIILEF